MSLTFLTGYILGQHGAQSARIAATAAAQTSGNPVSDIIDLNERVDRLILVIDAMWSLLEESGYTDEQLIARIQHIDEQDGQLDGRRTPLASDCSKCGAKVAPGLDACQFCGAAIAATKPDPLGSV
ncbi:MAG: hypothetical protein ACR2N2_01255 [Acidimicrobiia bacterium]